jgi:hypothetical protein
VLRVRHSWHALGVPEPPSGEIDRLYALPLEEFTRERDELARRLRKEGARDAAAAVKALKKPSVAAWAVNQVRRDRPDDVRRLLEVTDELHRVYKGLSAAGARERLGEAADMQRDLVRALVRCAEQLLEAGGHSASEQTLGKIADTFRAAALDSELREQVSAGRVVKEQRAAGLGPLETLPPPAKKPKAQAKKTAKRPPNQAGPDPKQVAEAERAVEAARRQLEEAERRRRELGG